MAVHYGGSGKWLIEEQSEVILTIGTFLVALIGALFAWGRLGSSLSRPQWEKENYRGRVVVGVSGVFVILIEVLVIGNLYWGFSGSLYGAHALAALMLVLAFGLLGWLDDTRAKKTGGGLQGHLEAVISDGTFSTGMLKLVGGILVSFGAVIVADVGGGLVGLARSAAIVALGANLLNLLDRAPARSSKVALLWFLALLVSTAVWGDSYSVLHLIWASGVVGASVGLAPSELMERHMQGDTGVNATGAVLGFSTVLVGSSVVEWIALVVLALLNLVSERTSFSQVIAENATLDRLDRLGAQHRKK
jgi:UDP-GlcNAc:undecaprenyl-phosphate GlcNAc-1-phosphate transferase